MGTVDYYWQGIKEGATKGAAATADGFIPFANPFEAVYVDSSGSVPTVFMFSRIAGGASRDLLLTAVWFGPNLAEWATNPALYEIGSKTLPTAAYNALGLEGLGAIQKGQRIIEAQGLIRAILPQWGAYGTTIGTGVTPGGGFLLIGVLEYFDH